MNNKPLDNSYAVCKNLYAGEYPGDKNEEKARLKISRMIEFGVRHFIDLTEEHELRPYSHLLPPEVTYYRFPIRDCDIPDSIEDVVRLVDHIKDLTKKDNGYTYVHCWGGVGRTGTIVGCYLAEDSYGDTINRLRSRFADMPKSAYRVTPETKAQEDFIRRFLDKKLEQKHRRGDRIKDCIRGSLMAGAAGDALGYPVEFMSRQSILSRYGSNGITHFETDRNWKALVSDDTQMTLFTANGMLMGITRGAMRGIGGNPENYVDGAYVDWYFTQTGEKSHIFSDSDFHYTWLRDLPELAHRRAPGMTCLEACKSLLHHQSVHNNSKGCGGIMRVAPMGLLAASYSHKFSNFPYHTTRLAEAGAKIAKVTHLHPLGFLPASLLTLLISRLVPLTPDEVKTSILEFIEEDLEIMMKMDGREHLKDKEYLRQLTLEAVNLANSDLPDAEAIPRLGEGWTAEEAWAISLFCSIRHIDSISEAIIAAVNHDGDSDSTGSITGNIMGAIYGYEAILNEKLFCPDGMSFENTLELHDIILALADDIYSGCIISEYDPIETPEKRQWYERYCKMKPAGL